MARSKTRRSNRVPSFRSLLTEHLERRLLLAAVTSEDPAANSFDAPVSTNVSATFDEAINPASATTDTFIVASQGGGRITSADATVSVNGQTITLDPNANFRPGERVYVTATSGIQGTSANEPHVWEFRTGVSAGSGQFTNSGQTLGGDQDGEIWYSDLDSDGDLDFVRAGASVWLNDGNGIFTDTGQALGGTNGVIADVDGDGDADILEANNVYINDGNGIFSGTGQDLTPAGGALAVEAGDVDGDGDIDAISGIAYSGNIVWLNNGSGTFANSGQSLGSSASRGLALGDFDGDGDLDLIAANNGQANRVWLNDGNGVFSDTQQLGAFEASNQADTGDVDGDGDLDIVISSNPGTRLYLNDGNGVFVQSGPIINPGTSNEDAQLGDLDGDGDLDVYATGWNNDSEIWANDGSGNFSQSQNLNPGGFHRSGWVGLFDVDSDGDLDAVQGQRFTGVVVWINQNLEPTVSLSVDETSIAEAGGVATVTATLSDSHTQPVTIDLAASGSATAGDDYSLSGNQIVIAAGDTSGSVTVTANQDSEDEPDETVTVDITSITNGQGGGSVTVTIVDDDEPVPNVTLSVDTATIAEAGGVATFTATLSATTDVPVTVDLGISGTATATDDYTASGAQIVIVAGDTSGSVTVTAVNDTADEPDETVIVSITGVTNGLEEGEQSATTTIVDDDEPVMPDVTLSVDNAAIDEAGDTATFTATLSEATTGTVTVNLALSGTATAGSDYNASGTQIVIAAGDTSGSITVTAVDDDEDEANETVVVDIESVTGGNEAGTQQQTTAITDDDAPPGFTVTSLTATESGFVAQLSTDLDPSELNLYDTQNLALGDADATLVGASSGPVRGSLIVDDSLRSVTFIKAGGPLEADSYTVTLRSGADGFKDAGGQLLDGNGDGTAGDNYSGNFDVAEPAAGTVTLSIPDFTRGPGQEVNLPADSTDGIPVTIISEGDNVRAVDLRIGYDSSKLSITGATVGADAPAGATVIVNTNTPGLAILVFFSSNALNAGSSTLVNLQATVPTENAGAIYATQQVIDLHSAVVSDGNDNEAPVQVDDAVQLVSYFSDVSGNRRTNAADASQVARYAALIDTGFAGSILTDPILAGDVSGNNRINAADASLVAQFAALISVPVIPPIPGGVIFAGAPNLVEPTVELTDESSINERISTDDSTFQVVDLFSSETAGGLGGSLVDEALADDDSFASDLEDAIEELF